MATTRRPANQIVDIIDTITKEFAILPVRVTELLAQARGLALAKDARTGKREKSKPYTAGRKRKTAAKKKAAKRRSVLDAPNDGFGRIGKRKAKA